MRELEVYKKEYEICRNTTVEIAKRDGEFISQLKDYRDLLKAVGLLESSPADMLIDTKLEELLNCQDNKSNQMTHNYRASSEANLFEYVRIIKEKHPDVVLDYATVYCLSVIAIASAPLVDSAYTGAELSDDTVLSCIHNDRVLPMSSILKVIDNSEIFVRVIRVYAYIVKASYMHDIPRIYMTDILDLFENNKSSVITMACLIPKLFY